MQPADIEITVEERPARWIELLDDLGDTLEPLGRLLHVAASVDRVAVPFVGKVPGDDAGMVPTPPHDAQRAGAGVFPERVALDVVLASGIHQFRDQLRGHLPGLVAEIRVI